MPLEITDLAQLPTTAVATSRDQLTQMVQELFPSLSLRSGVVHDIILEIFGALQAAQGINWQRLQQSMSLAAINRDPTLSDDEIVDGVLSNYLITRTTGVPASGQITILLSAASPVAIGDGTEFFANGVTFVTQATYTARLVESSVTAATDRLLIALGDGTYLFTVPVVATTAVAAGALRQGVRLITEATIPGLLKLEATADFVGGVPAETNAELIGKLGAGLAIAAWADRDSISRLIRKQAEFLNLLNISITGCGDVEMTRDKHGLCPISHGGRTDVYVRSQALLQARTFQLSATYISQGGGGGLWQMTIPADTYPGFYRVLGVRLPTAVSGTFSLQSVTYATDLDDTAPDIATVSEAMYSAYQTAILRFVDNITTTIPTAGDTANYVVELQGLPLIGELQAFANSPDTSPPTSDVLMRAAIPCILALSFVLYTPANTATVDQTAIRVALADYVNNLGFTDRIFCSALQHIIAGYLPGNVNVGRIELAGQLYAPDAETTVLRSFDVLEVPAAGMVSKRTMCFFLDPADVRIQVQV